MSVKYLTENNKKLLNSCFKSIDGEYLASRETLDADFEIFESILPIEKNIG